MKNTLIRCTGALAACILAPLALAQSPSVGLYGIADASVRTSSGLNGFTPSAASGQAVMSGVNETSRFGLRGAEDLGGGLKAILNLESGINVDTGTTANTTKFWDRAAVVGLEGPLGSVIFGRSRTLLGDAVAPVDPLGMRMASFNPNILAAALSQASLGAEYGPSGSTTGSYRLDNAVKAQTKFGGTTLAAMVGFGEKDTASHKASSSIGARAQHDAGALTLSGGYQKFYTATELPLTAWVLGAGYRIGGARATLTYGRSTADTSATAQSRYSTLGAGVEAPLSGSLLATLAYYDVNLERTGKADGGYRRLVGFLEYALSRRTKAYGALDHTRWQGDFQGAANKDTATGLSVGVLHRF